MDSTQYFEALNHSLPSRQKIKLLRAPEATRARSGKVAVSCHPFSGIRTAAAKYDRMQDFPLISRQTTALVSNLED